MNTEDLMKGSALAINLPNLTTYQKLLLKFCIYEDIYKDHKTYRDLRSIVKNEYQTYTLYADKNHPLIHLGNTILEITDIKAKASLKIQEQLPNYKEILEDVIGSVSKIIVKEKLPDIARTILTTANLEELPIIADILAESGSNNFEIINHFSEPRKHYPGCWAFRALRDLV